MIEYQNSRYFLCQASARIVCRSNYHPAFVGFLCAGLYIVLQIAHKFLSIPGKEATFDSAAYTAFTFLISFLSVFQTSQAYARFWEGAGLIHMILGDWFDVAGTLISYTRYSTADPSRVIDFRQKLVRLCSLLNSLLLGELEGIRNDDQETMASHYELIDVAGLDVGSFDLLSNSDRRPEMVFQWLQNEMVDSIKSGVLSIPAPLLTRSFQELGAVMIHFHSAMKLATTPFPFPYMAAMQLLLCVHSVVTPFAIAQWTESVTFGCLFTFLLVFMLWALHYLALELQNPFEADANDLNMAEIQCSLNRFLVALLSDEAQTVKLAVTPEEAAERIKKQFRDPERNPLLSRLNSFHHLVQQRSGSSSHLGELLEEGGRGVALWKRASSWIWSNITENRYHLRKGTGSSLGTSSVADHVFPDVPEANEADEEQGHLPASVESTFGLSGLNLDGSVVERCPSRSRDRVQVVEDSTERPTSHTENSGQRGSGERERSGTWNHQNTIEF